MKIKIILIVILAGIVSFWLTLQAHASDKYYRKQGVSIDLGGRTDPLAIGGEISILGEIYDRVSFKAGLSFLGLENDNLFGGYTMGIQYRTGHRLSPFIGLGAFYGYSERKDDAEDDNIDNDNDGFVDESGEEKEVIDDTIASLYPEIGMHFWVTDKTRLTMSSKYQITTKGRDHDFWMFSLGRVNLSY